MPRGRSSRLLAVAAALVLLSAGALALVLLRDSGTETLETPDFRFDYPSDWERIEGVQFPTPTVLPLSGYETTLSTP